MDRETDFEMCKKSTNCYQNCYIVLVEDVELCIFLLGSLWMYGVRYGLGFGNSYYTVYEKY